MNDLPIPADDRERIEAMVAQYRHSIENLYRMGYLQGQIEHGVIDLRKLEGGDMMRPLPDDLVTLALWALVFACWLADRCGWFAS